MSVDDEAVPERQEWIDESVAGSLTSRQRIREQLSADIEAFLASGGQITEVQGPHVGVRPRKPAGESQGSSF